MANWPRSIKPEDRVKYLVNARAIIQDQWGLEGEVRVEDGVAVAYHQGLLIGEFETASEALKALTDHLVVKTAIQQAWEDVAT